ncbi:MAG: hypothetical protein C0497_07565, partial [Gemmatimonas sp.]|nr:hypothetical protein [Gemmatimonas sp.]
MLAWKAQLRRTVFSDPSVTFLDADEGSNRITIGIVDLNDETRVRTLALLASVPPEAIAFVERGRPQLLQNLRQNYSPRIGGLGI